MKRIMILLCMLMVACPIKGADSSASSSQSRLGVAITYEPLEVDSPDDKGKEEEEIVGMVHLKREGHEIVPPFAIALLDRCHAGVLMTAAGRFVQDDKEAWIRSIFQDYTDDQIRLFVGALDHNSEDDAAVWVNELSNNDCILLIEMANCWDIKHIMQVCQERLARDITDTDADALSGDVQCLLKDQFKPGLSDLNWHILKRLSFPSRDLFCISSLEDRQFIPSYTGITAGCDEMIYRYGKSLCNEQRLIFPTERHVIIYDFATDSWTAIKIDAKHNLDHHKEDLWASAEEDTLLIRTHSQLIQYDFNTKTSKQIFGHQQFVRAAFGNVLIVSLYGIYFYNSEANTIKSVCNDEYITYWRESPFRESPFREVIDSNDIWFIRTSKYIIRCDKKTGGCKNIIINNGEITNIASNNEQLFIITDRKHMFLYDVQEDTIRELDVIIADNECIDCIEDFSEDGSRMLIRVSPLHKLSYMLIYDIDEQVCKKIPSDNFDESKGAYYIGDTVVMVEQMAAISGNRRYLKYNLMSYNVETEAISRVPFNYLARDFKIEYTSDKVILISNDNCVYSYRFKENQVRRIFCTNNGEHIYSAHYIHNGQAMLIYTEKRIVIISMPISPAQYEQLSLQQLQLLSKALPSWKLDKPYELAVDEFDLYKSLPEGLQTKQLFSTYYVDINDNPMNPSMFMGDVTYGQAVKCQVM